MIRNMFTAALLSRVLEHMEVGRRVRKKQEGCLVVKETIFKLIRAESCQVNISMVIILNIVFNIRLV